MRHYYFKAIALACLLTATSVANAKDIKVSANGDVKTLSQAAAIAENGDVIYVDGTITDEETAVFEGTYDEDDALVEGITITIVGTNNATVDLSGCAGSGIATKGCNLTLRNLTFAGCEDRAVNCNQGNLVIENCTFSENEGGGLFALNTNATITDCQFLENSTNDNGGGADLRGGTASVNNCVFSDNSAGNAGGGLSFIDVADVKVTFCTINDNSCGARGAGLNIQGGCESVKVLSTAIVYNTSTDHAGGIQCQFSEDRVQKVVFGACTIAGNTCGHAGASFFNDGPANTDESALNFVNCTIMGNETGDNIGNSAGVWFYNFKAKVNIVNTILEGNWAAGNERWSDGWWRDVNVSLRNSIVGYIFQYDEYEDNFSMVNTEWITTENGTDEPLSELNPKDDLDEEHYCYPLVPNSLPTRMGVVEDASRFGVGADQFGQPINKPYIGAVMLLQGEEFPEVDGIENVNVQKVTDSKFYNLAGQRVTVDTKGIIINNGKKYIVK